MTSRDQTTVNLTELAQKVKIREAPIWGLKQILSAGLILFDKLPADEQKGVIAKANGLDVPSAAAAPDISAPPPESPVPKPTVKEILRMVTLKDNKKLISHIKLLTPEDQKLVHKIREQLTPEKKGKSSVNTG